MDRNNSVLAALNNYLINQFKYKTNPASFGLTTSTIIAQRKKFKLYFRLIDKSGGLWEVDTFVIARISFRKEITGLGTHLLQFLSELVSANKFRYIGIEYANKNSSAFANKFGFSPIDEDHYIISIEKLIDYFKSKNKQ